jgi:hypothetical protein
MLAHVKEKIIRSGKIRKAEAKVWRNKEQKTGR